MRRGMVVLTICLAFSVLALAGDGPARDATRATADLKNAAGEVVGRAHLRQSPHGVLFTIHFNGMPAGRHALHVHEKGACEEPDFKSAGGHLNPEQVSHGYLTGTNHHMGDMTNFEVPTSGEVTVEKVNGMVTLADGRRNSLLRDGGSALVVHSGTDDYRSQPSGDAGKRIACGVIGTAK